MTILPFISRRGDACPSEIRFSNKAADDVSGTSQFSSDIGSEESEQDTLHSHEARTHRQHNQPPRESRVPSWHSRRSPVLFPSKDEIKLRSIAHSILLSTHQIWCKGDCKDIPRFVGRAGDCGNCHRRGPDVHRQLGSQSVPNCRIILHCGKVGHALMPLGSPDQSFDICDDAILRLGYAYVYCCYIGSFLTIEEYKVYRHGQIDMLDLGIWAHDDRMIEEMHFIKLLGHRGGVGGDGFEPEESKFLENLGDEMEETSALWSTVMRRARASGGVLDEEMVLRVTERMSRTGRLE